MERHRNELEAELKRITEENLKLASMVELMLKNYRNLQAQFIKQQEEYSKSRCAKSMAITRRLDLNIAGQQEEEEDFSSGGKCMAMERSVDGGCASAVSQQTSESSLEKLVMVDDSQLPSKKRKTNYVVEESENEAGNSPPTLKDSTPKKKQNRGLSRGSAFQVQGSLKKVITVRTRSETTKDGCHWRKYGQKMTRNNPCPRSYFKCGMSPSCPVKKQVQRSPQDPSALIVTYRGEHDHLLGPVDRLPAEMPYPVSVSSSSFPTISLDLTAKSNTNPNPNPSLFHGYPQLAEHLSTLYDRNMQGPGSNPVGNIKAGPEFAAALAVAIAGSVLHLSAPLPA